MHDTQAPPQLQTNPYARARVTQLAVDAPELALELLTQSPGEVRRFGRAVRRAARRVRWHRLVQMRCSKIAAAVAACVRVLGPTYAGRSRASDKSWNLYARSEDAKMRVAIVVAPLPVSRVEKFKETIRVRVLWPEVVAVSLLEAELNRINQTWGNRDARTRVR